MSKGGFVCGLIKTQTQTRVKAGYLVLQAQERSPRVIKDKGET